MNILISLTKNILKLAYWLTHPNVPPSHLFKALGYFLEQTALFSVLYVTPFLLLLPLLLSSLSKYLKALSGSPLTSNQCVPSPLQSPLPLRVTLKPPAGNFREHKGCRFLLSAVFPGGRGGQATLQSLPGIWAGSTPVSSTLPLTGLGPVPCHNPHVRQRKVICIFFFWPFDFLDIYKDKDQTDDFFLPCPS